MAYTDPFVGDVAELVKQAVTHHFYAVAVPITGASFDLDVESLSITFSDSWSPHIQASVTCRVPLEQEKLDALDGRKGVRIKIYAGYIYTGRGEDVHMLADLALRDRTVKRPSNQMDLTLASDEVRAQDYLKVNTLSPDDTGVNECVTHLNPYVMRPEVTPVISSVGAGYGSADLAAFTWERGESAWDIINEAAIRTGLWIYVDGERNWRIEPRNTDYPDPPKIYDYKWDGVPGDSTSTRTDDAGVVTKNIIENGSFERGYNEFGGIDGWTYFRNTSSGDDFNVTIGFDVTTETRHVKVTPKGGSGRRYMNTDYMPVKPNTQYTFGYSCKLSTENSFYMGYSVQYYDSAFTYLGGRSQTFARVQNIPGWHRDIYNIYLTPANTAYAVVFIHDNTVNSTIPDLTPDDYILLDEIFYWESTPTSPLTHFDGDTPDEYVSGDAFNALELTVGEDGTLISSDTALSREEWFNCVYLKYEFEDAAGASQTVYGRAHVPDGDFGTEVVGWKTFFEERNSQATAWQANRVAKEMLKKLSAKGRSFSLTATAAYWLRPGMPISVQLPTGPAERHIVQSVTFNPQMGSMSILTRLPENVTIIEG